MKNLTEIIRNIAQPPAILIQVEAVYHASECLFMSVEAKEAVAAVIVVTLSGIMVMFLPVSFQMVTYGSLSHQRSGKA
jgi:hypothetical protein